MEEETLKSSIETYKLQLEQVELTIQAAGETDDLVTLKQDLQKLLNLTQDSLLSLKKSQLLSQLDQSDSAGQSSEVGQRSNNTTHGGSSTGDGKVTQIDDEYAAFQAMLAGDISDNVPKSPPVLDNTRSVTAIPRESTVSKSPPVSDNNGSVTANLQESTVSISCGSDTSDIYKDIIGTKCRAPYSHDWGEKSYGNALIAGVQETSDMELPKLRVMFCNPTHSAMLPCRYFLEGNCRFSDQDCRYSHGNLVNMEDLQEFQEPDYSILQLESRCLARYDDDDLWYKATVVDHPEGQVVVTFDSYNDEAVTLPLEDVIPLDKCDDSSDCESDVDNAATSSQPISRDDSDDDDALPVFLWKPPSHGLGDLGQWEAHTKGIASKLMTKMGYVPGQGLGKAGEGRLLPVPIQLLPQGKSLDKVMRLKELAGEQDLFDVMKKQEKKMKKQAEKLANSYHKAQQPNMFDFINKKLGRKKGKLSELIHKHEGHGEGQQAKGHGRIHRNISEHDLTKKSDRNINIQLLKTGEEMKSVQKELAKLKQSLSRNQDRDPRMARQVKDKIQSLESYLAKLESSEQTMQHHQKKRSDHKKLTVF